MNNSKVLIFSSCLFAATLSAPLVTAGAHGGHPGMGMAGHPGMGMPGRPGMGMPGRPGMDMPVRPGMGTSGRPGMGMLSGGNRHVGDWHHHNDHFDHFDHHDHFHHHEVIFIGSFGFPWWWGWGWDPWWWWGWGYPSGYYGYSDPYGYGYGYGQYGDASPSRVAELQRKLAHAGYYHGSIDGVLGPRTRQAIRAYERNHGYAS